MKISEISPQDDNKFIDIGPVTVEFEREPYFGKGYIYYKAMIAEPVDGKENELKQITVSTHLDVKHSKLISFAETKQKLMITNLKYSLKYHSLTMGDKSEISIAEES
jgi:hypothetical protein